MKACLFARVNSFGIRWTVFKNRGIHKLVVDDYLGFAQEF